MKLTREELKNRLIEKKEKYFWEERLASFGQMVSGVTQDFINLFSGLLGQAELLNLKLDPAHPASPQLQGILKAIQRSKNITHPLLDFSQPQAKRDEKAIVNDVIAELKTLIAPILVDSIEIETELETEVLVAEIDGSHLQQILMTLKSNARDAMPLGGEKLIWTSISDSSAANEYGVNPATDYVRV